MLACIAEGRSHPDDEEAPHRKGAELRCDLSLPDIDSTLEYVKATEIKTEASNPTMNRINATSYLAMRLAAHMKHSNAETRTVSHSLLQH